MRAKMLSLLEVPRPDLARCRADRRAREASAVREWRHSLGWSQEAAADWARIPIRTFKRIEAGESEAGDLLEAIRMLGKAAA
jgi:DNA-binding XRE family transcriptional regulator